MVSQRSEGESWEINLQSGEVTLTGWLAQVQNDGLLRWRPGVLNMSDGLLLWLEHLIYCASGGTGTSRMYGRQQSCWRFPVASDTAEAALAQYIDGFRLGMSKPLMLLNKSGGAWLEASYDKKASNYLAMTALSLRRVIVFCRPGQEVIR